MLIGLGFELFHSPMLKFPSVGRSLSTIYDKSVFAYLEQQRENSSQELSWEHQPNIWVTDSTLTTTFRTQVIRCWCSYRWLEFGLGTLQFRRTSEVLFWQMLRLVLGS